MNFMNKNKLLYKTNNERSLRIYYSNMYSRHAIVMNIKKNTERTTIEVLKHHKSIFDNDDKTKKGSDFD